MSVDGSAVDHYGGILVTGGAGFIGSHLVDALLGAGHAVAAVDDLSRGRAANVARGARLGILDIRDEAFREVVAATRPEVIVHAAAQIDVRAAMVDPVDDASVNVVGSVNVLWAAMEHGVRKVVYLSSGGALYGETAGLPADEAHPIRPGSAYGVSKHAVEGYLELFGRERGLDWTVLRLPNVYGPRQDPSGEAGVIAIFAGQMLAGRPCTIFGDGEQARDFLYVDDAVSACLAVLSGRGSRSAYNLGWGTAVSVSAVHAALAAITGHPHPPLRRPARPGEAHRICLDGSRARRELGWRPVVSLEEGLRRTVAHLRAGADGGMEQGSMTGQGQGDGVRQG